MSRDKQIEEMAKDLCDCMPDVACDTYHLCYGCPRGEMAEYLYNAGYRKSTDVAREIFEEIMQAIEKGVADGNEMVVNSTRVLDFREVLLHTGEMYAGHIGKSICEVFKKYESEGEG